MKLSINLALISFCLLAVASMFFNDKQDEEYNISSIGSTLQAVEPNKQLVEVTSVYVATSYADALEESKARKQDLLLFFEADWCHWCHELKDKTLVMPSVQVAMSKYIVYYVNIDDEPALARKYLGRNQSVPQYMVVNNDEDIKRKGSGFKSSRDFLSWLQ